VAFFLRRVRFRGGHKLMQWTDSILGKNARTFGSAAARKWKAYCGRNQGLAGILPGQIRQRPRLGEGTANLWRKAEPSGTGRGSSGVLKNPWRMSF
jgi:hypothetical protein